MWWQTWAEPSGIEICSLPKRNANCSQFTHSDNGRIRMNAGLCDVYLCDRSNLPHTVTWSGIANKGSCGSSSSNNRPITHLPHILTFNLHSIQFIPPISHNLYDAHTHTRICTCSALDVAGRERNEWHFHSSSSSITIIPVQYTYNRSSTLTQRLLRVQL